jgi:hypothetical protein
MSKVGYKALVEAAEARIRTISAVEAIDKRGADDAVFTEPKEFVFFCDLGWRSALAAGGEVAQSKK